MMRHQSAILFFLFLSFGGYGQQQFGRINHYDELNGIIISDLLSDRNGEIWIATFSGLMTFDGYRFRNFYPDPKDSTTIDDLLLYKLEEGKNGDIWIGSMNKIYRHDVKTGRFVNYPLPEIVAYPPNAQPMVTQIEPDGNGVLYFGIQSGMGFNDYPGLLRYSESENSFEVVTLPNGEPVQNVYHMRSNKQGEIALVCNQGVLIMGSGGTRFYDFDQMRKLSGMEQEFIRDMVWDNDGNIWFVTDHWHLGKFDLATETIAIRPFMKPFSGIPDGTPRLGFDNRRLWISHRDGIELFDMGTGRFDALNTSRARPFYAFHLDQMGNIWLGTWQYGLYSIPPKKVLTSYLHNPDDPNSVTEGWVSNPFEDEQGNIWFATFNWAGKEGLNKINPQTGKVEIFLFRDILPQFNNLQMVDAYDKGKILFRSGSRLYGYDVNTGSVVESPILNKTQRVDWLNSVYRDSEGSFWICTMNGLYEQSGESYHIYDFSKTEMGQVVSNEVLKVVESKRGGLWVQTNEGLFYLDKDADTVERHGFDPNKGPVFSSQDINSLLEDDDGLLWVGTWQGGLNRYNPETREIRYYSIEDGLPSPSVQGILEDKGNGVLWMSTFHGIARFDKKTESFTSFGNEEGAQSLYADNSSLKLSNGLFAFGGSNGITVFNPADFADETLPPITRITGMKAGDEAITLVGVDPPALDYGQNNLSISYTGIHYDNPANNQFAYRLSPVDDDWRYVGGSRSAYYYDLEPGDYTFSVRAANPNLVWSEPQTISFTIAPPWWRTTWAYVLFALLLAMMAFQFHRFQKQRTIRMERERTQSKELEQAREIEKAYEQLKATQTQLIHSEKMASLGELTAGIAHEIQNPLNFVNNFSELNSELIREMKEEMGRGNVKEVEALANDIDENEQKINFHGKRADSIVKGMLQHSRSNDGQKEPTDLNRLADEYLRLAYHGLRARDNSFNAATETDFDKDLGVVEVVPQDIGRVLLNLLTNAFHAVQERKKKGEKAYEPTVTVRTIKEGKQVRIEVSDNGDGMPDEIMAKIFQPFFTTKPTGQGTGLGLSMSYDIVTKGHGGSLKAASKTGEGSKFMVILPV